MSSKILFFFRFLPLSFKGLILGCLGLGLFTSFSQAEESDSFFKDIPCAEDIKKYSSDLSTGELTQEEQNRFFECVWGVLDLVVEKEMIVHDKSRDYFKREEIFRLFNGYFEYDEKTSLRFTNFIFVAKKILVGGSIDKLKDKEVALIYRLIYDYRDAYYIVHKLLPLFINANNQQNSISKEQTPEILKKFERSFKKLKRAYQRENVVYILEDNRYGENLKANKAKAHHLFSLFHALFEGVLFPQTKIKGQSWDTAFKILYKGVNLFLYYKTHFKPSLTNMEKQYALLEAGNLFLDILSENPDQGFPVKSLDTMLVSATGLLPGQSSSLARWLSKLKHKNRMALVTRSFLCLSLKHPKGCKIDKQNSEVHVSFPDSEFILSQNEFLKKEISTKELLFFTPAQIQALNQWIDDYQEGIQHIYYGWIQETAIKYGFDRWLDPFFGWNKHGLVFGAFDSSPSPEKSFWILQNQVLLSLLLGSYMPKGFFSSTQQSLSIKQWQKMLLDFSPVLSVFLDTPSHNLPQQYGSLLFSLADQFLNSSDKSESLNSKELLDLSVHLFSALKQSNRAFTEVSNQCDKNNIKECLSQKLVEKNQLLSAYPRFKSYILTTTQDTYYEKISSALADIDTNNFQSMDLLPLFFLIQVMETNYHFLDQNQSFNLESHELLGLAHSFKNDIYINIPYVYSEKQALSYIMYSFKTGFIPFFTGPDETPIQFSYWHLNPESRKAFTVPPHKFHFLIFDLYNFYKNF